MSEMMNYSIYRWPYTYQIAVTWNEAAFSDGDISFGITVTKTKGDSDEGSVEISATMSVAEGENERPVAKFELLGREFELSLEDLTGESDFVDRIPAAFFSGGEPVTGCLLRSGISATLGQVLECKSATENHPWFRERTMAVGNCVRNSIPEMGAKLAFRATECILRDGF